MKLIYLYTNNFSLFNSFKLKIKRILGVESRGPQAVEDSLMVGLNQLKQPYILNKNFNRYINHVFILSGAKTLSWAINKKQTGKIGKIFAGPNIVISPNDFGGILKNYLIDRVIVPCMWVKEFYIKVAPELANKIDVWPAGVDVPKLKAVQKEYDFLVYKKNCPEDLFLKILDYLNKNQFRYKILVYGNFKQEDYFNLLEKSKYLIYLSASESQGIAMFEAWARNVPTIIWEPGEYKQDGVTVLGKVACPYLNESLGLSFFSINEFGLSIENILKKKIEPKQFVLENYTNKICAEKLLKIINA